MPGVMFELLLVKGGRLVQRFEVLRANKSKRFPIEIEGLPRPTDDSHSSWQQVDPLATQMLRCEKSIVCLVHEELCFAQCNPVTSWFMLVGLEGKLRLDLLHVQRKTLETCVLWVYELRNEDFTSIKTTARYRVSRPGLEEVHLE